MHSACWNNGNPDVFVGKYDYDQYMPLDKNIITTLSISGTDNNFESKYNNRKFAIDRYARVHRYFIDLWLSKTESVMSGNGFTFGSKTTKKVLM